jgi:hypothetical protein
MIRPTAQMWIIIIIRDGKNRLKQNYQRLSNETGMAG